MPSRSENATLLTGALVLTFSSSCWGLQAAYPLFSVLQGELRNNVTSLTYMLILLVGQLLCLKKQAVVHALGFQTVILSCLLPSLLFKAVVSLEGAGDAWQYAVIAVTYILYLQIGFKLLARLTHFPALRRETSTLAMMFCSLAPGLSSLPFVEAVVENIPPYLLGVGHVGVADFGVKFNVLFISYFVAAMRSQATIRRCQSALSIGDDGVAAEEGGAGKACRALTDLVRGYFAEPVNVSSLVALTLMLAGPVGLPELWILGDAVRLLSGCCIPAIFLLIGIKLKRPTMQQAGLLALMVARSGLAQLFVMVLQRAMGLDVQATMFWIFFCHSATSFWPYTHMVHFSSLECKTLVPMLSSAVSEAIGAMREVSETEKQTTRREQFMECIAALEQLVAKLDGGDPVFESRVDEARDLLAQAPSSSNEVVQRAKEALDKDLSPTFDVALGLLVISVSFSWSALLCMVMAFVPTTLWMHPASLPSSGAAMLLAGGLFLRAQAHWLEKQAREEEEEAEQVAEISGVQMAAPKGRRASICANMEVDELVAAEADQEVRRAAGARAAAAGGKADDEVRFGMRCSVAFMAPVGEGDNDGAMIRKSLFGAAGFMPQSAPAKRSVAFSETSSTRKEGSSACKEVRLSFFSATSFPRAEPALGNPVEQPSYATAQEEPAPGSPVERPSESPVEAPVERPSGSSVAGEPALGGPVERPSDAAAGDSPLRGAGRPSALAVQAPEGLPQLLEARSGPELAASKEVREAAPAVNTRP